MQSAPDTSGATLDSVPEKGEQYHENGSVLVKGPDADADAAADVPVAVRQPDEDIIPDGGLLAWLQVAGSWLLFFNSWGIINSFGVYQTYYEQEMFSHLSPDTISWIGSTQSMLILLVGVIAGPLYDMGMFRPLVISGSVMIVLGFMFTSLCTAYWQIMLSQAALIGVGTGFLYIPSLALLPRYFTTKRALATGIVTAGSSLGGTIYPIVFQQLQPRIGFGWATRVIGFISLATCTFAICVLRPRGKPSTRRSLVDMKAFTEPPYIMYCCAIFCSYFGYFGPIFYLQPYALSHGLKGGMVALYLVAILNAASIPGRIVPSYFAGKIGPINTMLCAATACGIVTLCWIAVKGTAGSVVFALAWGFSSGGIISMPAVILASLTEDMSRFGTRMGMSSFFNSIASLCGAPIAGAILKGTGSYLGVQLFCGFAILGTSAFLVTLRLYRTGWRVLAKI
ncbi:major facilitator superfamily domain-containing protein [Exophiala viscosa]|uniref:Major facilitator superfamily domain-containing protein n=1 Tax=Exophiala viscosa TaxID=2486360 RepID=A0AAN6DZS1_9EURO|nr:major facilitator superfamily domain-containing protein [Exophiala viscosa]